MLCWQLSGSPQRQKVVARGFRWTIWIESGIWPLGLSGGPSHSHNQSRAFLTLLRSKTAPLNGRKMHGRFENRNSPRRVYVHEIGLEDPFDRRVTVLSHVWLPRSGPKRTQNRPFRIPRDPSFWTIFRRSIFVGGVPDGTCVRILSTFLVQNWDLAKTRKSLFFGVSKSLKP